MKHLAAILGIAGLLVLGCGGLGERLWPAPSQQGVTITTAYPGAPPPDVEHSISVPVELAVLGIEGVQGVESLSLEGASVVTAWYDPREVDPYALRSAVLEGLQRAESSLPQDAEASWLGSAASPDRLLARVAVTGSEGWQACARDLAQQALTVPGVDRVLTAGLDTERLVIRVSTGRLGAANLGLDDVQRALADTTPHPSGALIRVPTLQAVRSIDELGHTVLVQRDGVPVYLSDVARIEVDSRPSAPRVVLDQQPAALLTFFHQPQADRASTLSALGQAMEAVEARCPAGSVSVSMAPSAQVLAVELGLVADEAARRELAGQVEAIARSMAPADVLLELGRPAHTDLSSALPERARLMLRYDRPPPDSSMGELVAALRTLPTLRVLGWEGPGSRTELLLRGEDHAPLPQVAEDLVRALELSLQQTAVDPGLIPEHPEIHIDADRERLAAYGISPVELAEAARAAIACLPLGEVGDGDADTLPVELCSVDEGDSPMLALLYSQLRAADGQLVPLSAVASVELRAAPGALLRVDLYPALRLRITSTEPDQRVLDKAVADTLEVLDLPAGVSVELQP
jgi:multidrug efflux pump subunit AcrB